jgi:glycosyltransferase involved in cell wall biosynthesis
MTAVTFDYTPAIQQHAGIGRYADELARALIALRPEDEWHLFYVDPENRVPAPPLDQVERTALRQSNKRWRFSVLLNTFARRAMDQQLHTRGGLFHATDHLLPPLAHTRSVFTLHDLTVLKFPKTHAQLNRRFLQLMLPRFLQKADVVIADSICTQQDALQLYRLPADRTRVVHLGVQARFKPADAVSARSVRERYRLPERFILAVSTIEPRKNLIVLLEAYQALRQRHSDIQLVIAGKRGWRSEPFFERLQALGLTDKVRLLGFVPDEDLPALYSLAEVFAFPSLYEGFGLPVLEAMACGTPVICSNASSLPEVAGEAALQIAPADVQAWTEALEQIGSNSVLRASLRERGLKQAARFTWENTARQTYAIYQEVYAAHRP